MVRVKICGICDFDAAQAAVEAGADLLGFHFCSSDQHAAEVREIADFVGLDLLQLHGSEQPGFDAGRPVIKVLKVREGQVPDAGAWPDPVMLDSWSLDQRGGTGQTWDWDVA